MTLTITIKPKKRVYYLIDENNELMITNSELMFKDYLEFYDICLYGSIRDEIYLVTEGFQTRELTAPEFIQHFYELGEIEHIQPFTNENLSI